MNKHLKRVRWKPGDWNQRYWTLRSLNGFFWIHIPLFMFRELVGTQGPQRLNHDSKQKRSFGLVRCRSIRRAFWSSPSLAEGGSIYRGVGWERERKRKPMTKEEGSRFFEKNRFRIYAARWRCEWQCIGFFAYCSCVDLRSKENRTGKNLNCK